MRLYRSLLHLVNVPETETVDILVPAHAEIVLEGTIDPSERKVDGACGEVSGYYGNTPVPKPVFRVKTVTYRNDPIFHGSLEGHPVDEDHALASIALSAYVWDILEMAGVRGIREVAMPLCACGGFGHAVISIKPMMHGHADTIASEIALKLRAEKLFNLSDVNGVLKDRRDPDSRISYLTVSAALALIEKGAVQGGMIPKLETAMKAVQGGVGRAHILNGFAKNALLREVFTRSGFGTMIIRDEEERTYLGEG